MPEGNYGTMKIGDRLYFIVYWSSLKSDCLRYAKRARDKENVNARVVKYPIRLGTLAGGGTFEQWAVAMSGTKKDYQAYERKKRKSVK